MWATARNPPDFMWLGWKATFDQLYAEGIAGVPKWCELTLHAHMGARPTMIPAVRQMLHMRRSTKGSGSRAGAISPSGRCNTKKERNARMKTVPILLAQHSLCAPRSPIAQPVKLKFAAFSPDTERLYNTVKKPFAAAVNAASGGTIRSSCIRTARWDARRSSRRRWCSTALPTSASSCRRSRPAASRTRGAWSCPGLFQDLAEATRVYTRLVAIRRAARLRRLRSDRDVGNAAVQPALQLSRSPRSRT